MREFNLSDNNDKEDNKKDKIKKVKRKYIRRKNAKRRPGRPSKKTNPKALIKQQKIMDIIALRKQGWQYKDIADAQTPKITPQRVQQIVSNYFEETAKNNPALEHLRELELHRLDEMQIKVWENALKGDLISVDRVLQIHDRRVRLLGVSAPEKVQVEEVGKIAESKAALLEKLDKASERLRLAHGIVIDQEALTNAVEALPNANKALSGKVDALRNTIEVLPDFFNVEKETD